MIMGGGARLAIHGVSRVDDGTGPVVLARDACAGGGGGDDAGGDDDDDACGGDVCGDVRGDVCRCVTAGIAVEPRGCPCEEAALAERLAHTRLNVNVRQVLPYDAAGYPTRTLGDGAVE